jgi:tRNA-dihydrouridine synthase A
MAEPDLVAECVAAMREAVSIPVTVKTRIGIDDQDDYAFLHHFVSKVHAAGCRTFIVHARKAVLSGLSPKENREIPPLIYQRGADVKRDFPECEVLLNGGIKSLSDVVEHLRQVDGVMIGREAYQNPWFLAQADTQIFGCTSDPLTSQQDIVKAYLPYLQQRHAEGLPVSQALRHLLGLFQGQAGARQFRRFLSENMHKPKAAPEILLEAVAHL